MKNITKKIEFTLFFPYPISIVWEALTRQDALAQWVMETDFKPEVGTIFQFRGKPNKFWRGYVECKVTQVESPKFLQFLWQSTANQTPTTRTYILKEEKDGTQLQVVHDGFSKSHGIFSGLFLRLMLKVGMKKEFSKFLPQVLENGKNGDYGKRISR